jgi:hypothetical protein
MIPQWATQNENDNCLRRRRKPGLGNRVGGTTTKYLVDSLNPTGYAQVIDELVGGAVTRTYAYGLQRISENQKISGTQTASFYGYDGHGNVRYLTSSAGTATDTYVYDCLRRLRHAGHHHRHDTQ